MALFVVAGLPAPAGAVTDSCGNTIPANTRGINTGFESSTYRAEWTEGSLGGFTWSSSVAKTGTWSLASTGFWAHATFAEVNSWGGAYFIVTFESSPFLIPWDGPELSFSYRNTQAFPYNLQFGVVDYYDEERSAGGLALDTTGGSWVDASVPLTPATSWGKLQVRGDYPWTSADSSYPDATGTWYHFPNGGVYIDDVTVEATNNALPPPTAQITSNRQQPGAQNYWGFNDFPYTARGSGWTGVVGWSRDMVAGDGTTAPALDSCLDTTSGVLSATQSLPLFGLRTMRARAVDHWGNWGPTTTYTFGVDRVSPPVSQASPTGLATPLAPINVQYNDKDVVSGQEQDPSETATLVDVKTVRLLVDGIDVIERDKATCAQLTGPVTNSEVYREKVYPAIQQAYEAVFHGDEEVGGVHVWYYLNTAPWVRETTDPIVEGLGNLGDAGNPVAQLLLATICSGAKITPHELTYNPIEPWSSGSHAAVVELADTAVGQANPTTYSWTFSTP